MPKSIAAEKEIVRDVTEKRFLHRVFIVTQSPNRLRQRRRLFVMSQRNVCYIVFSSRHSAYVAEHARRSPLRVRVTSSRLFWMGRRRPRPPWLVAPLPASGVEMMDFTRIQLMSHTNRERETYTEHARRCLVSPALETTSLACHRFSTSGFSGSCPTAAVAMNSP